MLGVMYVCGTLVLGFVAGAVVLFWWMGRTRP